MNGFCSNCGAPWNGTPFCTTCGKRMLPQGPEDPALPGPPANGFFPAPPPGPVERFPSPPGLPITAPAPELAPVGTRFLALALDEVVIHLLGWLVAMVAVGAYRAGAGFLPEGEGVTTAWWMSVSIVLGAAWHTAFLGRGGQTPGKRLLRVRVTRADGARLGYGHAFLRTLCYPLSLLVAGLGFSWALWDPRRQAWHDKIADTVVVRAE